MSDDTLTGRVGSLEAVVAQIAATQAQQVQLLERVVRLEEKHKAQTATIDQLRADVRTAISGVAAASPWVAALTRAGGGFLTAMATSVAAFVAVRFGLGG
jgi:hypothetical protein